MPRSFLIKKKSDRESPAEGSQSGPGCCDEDGGDVNAARDQPSEDFASLQSRKQEPEVIDATALVPVRRTTIWSPAAELHVGSNKTPSLNVSPASGLTAFTPLSAAAAAAAAFLHPKGNYLWLSRTFFSLSNFTCFFLSASGYHLC